MTCGAIDAASSLTAPLVTTSPDDEQDLREQGRDAKVSTAEISALIDDRAIAAAIEAAAEAHRYRSTLAVVTALVGLLLIGPAMLLLATRLGASACTGAKAAPAAIPATLSAGGSMGSGFGGFRRELAASLADPQAPGDLDDDDGDECEEGKGLPIAQRPGVPLTNGMVSAGRDPAIPRDKVADRGHDPFAATAANPVWESKDGTVRFDYRPEALDILEPETRLSGEVPLGEYLRGRVVKEGRPLIRYYPGNLPFVFVCIHTNTMGLRPWMKNWPPSRRACGSKRCKTLEVWRNFQALSDAQIEKLGSVRTRARMVAGIPASGVPDLPFGDGAGPACLRSFEYIGEKTGNYPHLIYSDIPKLFLDFNRQPASRYLRVPGTLATAGLEHLNPETWASYHDMINFAREAKNVVARQWGGGWNINFHSMGQSKIGIGFGIGFKNQMRAVLNAPEKTKVSDFVGKDERPQLFAHDYLARGLTPYECMFGRYAFGEQLSLRGVGSAPSRAFQYIKNGNQPKCYCGSTAFEGRFGTPSLDMAKKDNRVIEIEDIAGRPAEDWYAGHWNSAIAEMYSRLTSVAGRPELFNLTVEAISETAIDLAIDFYGTGIRRRDDYQNRYRSLSTIYDASTPASTCVDRGGLLDRSASSNGVHFLHECIDRCRAIKGCRFVVMDTGGERSNRRRCYYHRSCANKTERRFHTVFDVEAYLAGP